MLGCGKRYSVFYYFCRIITLDAVHALQFLFEKKMAPIKPKNFSDSEAVSDSERIIRGAPKGFFVKVKGGVAKNYCQSNSSEREEIDKKRRLFLKAVGVVGLSALGTTLFAPKADALGIGGAPPSPTVNLRNRSNVKINPATEEGLTISKKSVALTATGIVLTPTTGKKIRIYNTKFSLSADMTSVSFKFGVAGDEFEKYLAPKTGGLYGMRNHPNFIEGSINVALYCVISGTGTVQVNIDYTEFP
jgi:hypothetical protein